MSSLGFGKSGENSFGESFQEQKNLQDTRQHQTNTGTNTQNMFQNITGSQTETSDQNRAANVSGTTSSAGSSSASQKQNISTLDRDTQNLVKSLVDQMANDGQGAELVNLLQQRAQGADAAFDPTAIITEARRQGEKGINQAITQLSASTGSSQNSLVQALGLQERANMESQLAATEAQLRMQGRQAATGEMAGAAQLGQEQLVQLLNVLKGAQTTGSTSATQATNESQNQQQTINELISALTGVASNQNVQGSTQDIFDTKTVNTGRTSGVGTTFQTGWQKGSGSNWGVSLGD